MALQVLNGLDLKNQRIVNLADPSSGTDAVTKQYADSLIRGSQWKDPVRAATTTNGTLSTAFAAGQVIDGVTLVAGDPILLKNQTTGSENGIYIVGSSGAPTRRNDADTTGEIKAGMTVYVQEGSTNADKAYAVTTDGTITIGTTSIAFGQIGGGNTYTAGNGLQLSTNQFSILLDSSPGLVVSGTGLKADYTVLMRRYSTSIGNGSATTITVTHNLGTLDVIPMLYDTSTGAFVWADPVAATTNTVTYSFATAPASNAYRAVVLG